MKNIYVWFIFVMSSFVLYVQAGSSCSSCDGSGTVKRAIINKETLTPRTIIYLSTLHAGSRRASQLLNLAIDNGNLEVTATLMGRGTSLTVSKNNSPKNQSPPNNSRNNSFFQAHSVRRAPVKLAWQ